MPPSPDPAQGGEATGSNSGVDESLYSRQLYVMGHEAQVQQYNVLHADVCVCVSSH